MDNTLEQKGRTEEENYRLKSERDHLKQVSEGNKNRHFDNIVEIRSDADRIMKEMEVVRKSEDAIRAEMEMESAVLISIFSCLIIPDTKSNGKCTYGNSRQNQYVNLKHC